MHAGRQTNRQIRKVDILAPIIPQNEEKYSSLVCLQSMPISSHYEETIFNQHYMAVMKSGACIINIF